MSDINYTKIRRLDGALLLTFQELMRHHRTTTAAEKLNLSQSAVSHALARLRDIFDDPLFIRRPNGLEPTQRAHELAPQIEELIRLTQAALETGQAFAPEETGRNFRIGGGDFMSALISAPLLRLFEQEAPNASFVFRFSLGQEALDGLLRDEIDVAVGRFSIDQAEFISEHLYDERYCVVARKNHPHVNGSLNLATYSELGHVIIALRNDMEQFGDDLLKQHGIERRVVAAVPRFLTGLTLIAESDALMTVQRRLATRYANAFKLQVLEVPYTTQPFPIVAVRRKLDSDDLAINWLIDKIRNSSNTDNPL